MKGGIRNPERYTVQQVIDVLQETRGNLLAAGRQLGCSRSTVRNYIARHERVAAAYEEARESRKDWYESRLDDKAEAGDVAAIIFFLKTQAKDRGYIERNEMTGADGAPLAVTLVIDK